MSQEMVRILLSQMTGGSILSQIAAHILLSQTIARNFLSQVAAVVQSKQQTETTRRNHGPPVGEPLCGKKLVSEGTVFRDVERGRFS